jgi:putative ABC transport system permease protein
MRSNPTNARWCPLRLLKYALRDCIRNISFSLFFIANISIGATGFLIVSTVRSALEDSLSRNARASTGGDLRVSTRRPFTDSETKIVTDTSLKLKGESTLSIEFLSMLRHEKQSKLILVRAVDSKYPLVEGIKLKNFGLAQNGIGSELSARPVAWISEDIAKSMGLAIGSRIKLGNADLTISDFVTEDPSQGFQAMSLGGRIYISQTTLKDTGLLQPGSTAGFAHLIKLPADSNIAEIAIAELSAKITAPEVRLRTAKEAAEDSSRALTYIGDFLGIICLVNLLVACIAAVFLIRSFVEDRKAQFALLKCLGMSAIKVKLILIIEVWVLCIVSIIPAVLLAGIISPFLFESLKAWSDVELSGTIGGESIAILSLILGFGAPLLLLPELYKLDKVRPISLLREEIFSTPSWTMVFLLPAIVFFFALSIFVTHSYRNSWILLGTIVAVAASTWLILFFVKFLLTKTVQKNWKINHARLLFVRKSRASFSFLTAIALSSLLINALPQLENSISKELEAPSGSTLPSFFIFDIQEEQVDPLKEYVRSMGQELRAVAPLIRARIISINGQKYERAVGSDNLSSREEEEAIRFRNRGVNLSFRQELQSSETLLEGAPFAVRQSSDTSTPWKISVEYQFAKRLAIKMGDRLVFDIQGVEIEAVVHNLRSVKWNSFQPNFFIVFEPGPLNDAPKNYLANIPPFASELRNNLQSGISERFPNLSIVDVASAAKKIIELLQKMNVSIFFMSILVCLAGLAVLATVLSLEIKERTSDYLFFRILGASKRDLQLILLVEGCFVLLLALFIGTVGSLGLAFGVMWFVFDSTFTINWFHLIISNGSIFLLALFLGAFIARGVTINDPLESQRAKL